MCTIHFPKADTKNEKFKAPTKVLEGMPLLKLVRRKVEFSNSRQTSNQIPQS